MNKKLLFRWLVYILGLLVLALGITLNTKTGLGVSPIVSVAFVTSQIGGWSMAIPHWCPTSSLC